MQMKTPPPVPSVIKREDKMDTLKTFVSAHGLLAAAVAGAPQGQGEILLLARSAESPVARALLAVGAEIAARGIVVRAIFGQPEGEKSSAGWSVAGPEVAFRRELRWARNPRLADAHEQLVLGPATAWVGDCLRRDPSRRDAYEHFAADDATTARTMAVSFERLWAISTPLAVRTRPVGMIDSHAHALADDTLAALRTTDEGGGPLVSSQH
jgi:hypothetical protein